jgi:hypothetical protein
MPRERTAASGLTPLCCNSSSNQFQLRPSSQWRIKGEHPCYHIPVPEPRCCTVSFSDSEGIRHSVVVTATTLYEAVALGVGAFREQGLLVECHVGTATEISVEVRAPAVLHTISLAPLERWIEAAGRSPKERLAKERVREMSTGRSGRR